VGANLSIGQDVLTIIPLTNLWVTANFKETQLAKMSPVSRSPSKWTHSADASSTAR